MRSNIACGKARKGEPDFDCGCGEIAAVAAILLPSKRRRCEWPGEEGGGAGNQQDNDDGWGNCQAKKDEKTHRGSIGGKADAFMKAIAGKKDPMDAGNMSLIPGQSTADKLLRR